MFDRYRKEMAVNVEDIENILVAVLSGDNLEIYNALTKKKEIIDKSPKLRTVDEKNMLQSLSKKIRKFPKHLIDGIQKQFPRLQRTPKTAEQRKEQAKECMRQKRAAESETDKEMRKEQDKECKRQKRSAESETDKERRLKKQKQYDDKRYTQSTEFRAKKVQEVREKRLAESEKEKERRLNNQK